eukprot:gnl/TRDRNA2_/TRDRNA2_94685_c1_seq1.p1 gnl/TRDRNA2_/TRDRNA2_94685_c1~~gnl/TRDRNA2_/TRDRNA2_94685_c1_seq1.p1  ORF type:complete len:128 (+),score=15.08 gnl/TRDRNA2_/TRDRNA2_94685_c1_seq1:254-637(+)
MTQLEQLVLRVDRNRFSSRGMSRVLQACQSLFDVEIAYVFGSMLSEVKYPENNIVFLRLHAILGTSVSVIRAACCQNSKLEVIQVTGLDHSDNVGVTDIQQLRGEFPQITIEADWIGASTSGSSSDS